MIIGYNFSMTVFQHLQEMHKYHVKRTENRWMSLITRFINTRVPSVCPRILCLSTFLFFFFHLHSLLSFPQYISLTRSHYPLILLGSNSLLSYLYTHHSVIHSPHHLTLVIHLSIEQLIEHLPALTRSFSHAFTQSISQSLTHSVNHSVTQQ